MNLKIAWLLLNAKYEMSCSCSVRQWLSCDNQNFVAYIYILISNEEISKIEKTYLYWTSTSFCSPWRTSQSLTFVLPDKLIHLSKTRVSNARGSPRGTLMPDTRTAIKLQMPHPRDWQREQMPRGCPGGRGMGTAGIDWCIITHRPT